MGTKLTDIVQVNITRETAKITQAGFGTALIFGPLTEFTDRYRIYNSIEAVEVDFASDSEQWKAAAALFSQEVSPEKVVIGDRDTLQPLADDRRIEPSAPGAREIVEAVGSRPEHRIRRLIEQVEEAGDGGGRLAGREQVAHIAEQHGEREEAEDLGPG